MHWVVFAIAMMVFVACGIQSIRERMWLVSIKWLVAGASAFTFFSIMSGAIYWST